MEFKASEELFTLGDISDYNNPDDILPIGSATVIAINFVAALSRSGLIGGQSLNTYIDTFGLEGALANITLVLILFQIARWSYTKFYTETSHGWSPFVFVCALIVVQMIHDVVFYYGAINMIPGGKNEMIDVLKKYSNEHGPRALAAHAAFLIFVGIIAMFFKERSFIFLFIVTTVAFYALPYVITTFGPKPPPPPPPPPSEKPIVKAPPSIPGWSGLAY